MYPKWSDLDDGTPFEADELLVYDGKLYKVVQGHNKQSDWPPDTTAALFIEAVPDNVIPEWTQPTGAHDAYAEGVRVTHDNPNDSGAIWIYESTYTGNTTEPGRDGTYDRYWTPIERVT